MEKKVSFTKVVVAGLSAFLFDCEFLDKLGRWQIFPQIFHWEFLPFSRTNMAKNEQASKKKIKKELTHFLKISLQGAIKAINSDDMHGLIRIRIYIYDMWVWYGEEWIR